MPDPVTGIMAAASVAGAGANIFGANKAAGAIGDAAASANALAAQRWQDIIGMFKEYYGKGEAGLKPYTDLGTQAAGDLSGRLGDLTAPIMMDQETLEKTPGYQFTKAQGLRGVTQGNVLRGLSGAQLKGAGDFVTGLADNTYKTQFDIANTNKTNSFNRLFQASQAGQSAADSLLKTGVSGVTALASPGASLANTQSGNLMAAGNAQAGAALATGQQLGQTIAGAPYLPYTANKLYPNGLPGLTGMYSQPNSGGGGPGG